MPFIVTTKRLEDGEFLNPVNGQSEPYGPVAVIVSEQAVATHKEAIAKALEITLPYALVVQPGEDSALSIACWAIPESGGTVGPLPDGTVIEVEDVSPLMLGSRCQASGELMMGCLRDDDWAPLIAAFNAMVGHDRA